MPAPLKIFIIYAREDTDYKNGLIRALGLLKRQGLVEEWHDGNIQPGAKWEEEIGDHLRSADIILPLISYDFFGSDYIQNVEIEKAFARFEAGEAKILPIIVRKCPWQDDDRLARLQALPRDGKPISTWADRDDAYTDIIEALKVFIRDIYAEQEHAVRRNEEAVLARQRAADEEKRRKEQQLLEAERQRRLTSEQQRQQEEETRQREEQQRQENEAWQDACAADTVAAYQAYLDYFKPAPAYRREARAEIKRLKNNGKPDFWQRHRMALLAGLAVLTVTALLVIPNLKSGDAQKSNALDNPAPASPKAKPASANMVFVKSGKFQMGDLFNEGRPDEQPVHSVTVSDFYISKYEVTFEEFDAFCEDTKRTKPGDEGWGRGRRPLINVDWYDAVEYCNWLSQKENLTPVYTIDKNRKDPKNLNTDDDKRWTINVVFSADGYRLPTEAEWEYAARERGRKVRFGNSKDEADPAEINFDARSAFKKTYSTVGESRQKTVPVDALSANSLGLHHMSGNVWEWCWDWYNGNYYSQNDGSSDPQGALSGESRVVRGGSWNDFPFDCRAASRSWDDTDDRATSVFGLLGNFVTHCTFKLLPFSNFGLA